MYGLSEGPMLIGYARVSTAAQKLDLQKDALKKAGCERLFTDTASGAKAERTGMEQALAFARKRDTLLVWKLDRLGRSLRHLVETLASLRDRGIGFRSLQESIDTTTGGGKLVFHVFAALAELERDLIRERTRAGLDAARPAALALAPPVCRWTPGRQLSSEIHKIRLTPDLVGDIAEDLAGSDKGR
jgi:DNA invertase Pin-like site-specific DNA recombinase